MDAQTAQNLITHENLLVADAAYWAVESGIILGGNRRFSFEGHEYQIDQLQDDFPFQVDMKGAQMGFTEIEVLRTLHGHINNHVPQGTLYLLPTRQDVLDFSKGRFTPLITDNPETIGHYVQDTDAANIKRVGSSMLYFRGARATKKIEGVKKTSSQLKNIPVDRIVYDERDEMDVEMVQLADERVSHSEIKQKVSLSTPSIPDYGIDKLYKESDQRIWLIRCRHCPTETCLELEFPDSLGVRADGTVFRKCRHCGSEIYPRDGRWVAQKPECSKDSHGRWISQLNSLPINPKDILDAYLNPPNGNIAEVYNSKLAMAYIAAENRLTKNDVFNICTNEPMAIGSEGPAAMGVDVGNLLHVIVGIRVSDVRMRALYMARVSSFNDLHDIAKRFNVRCAVIDLEPEIRKAREFRSQEPYPVWLCDYREHHPRGAIWNQNDGLVTIDRTEICDTTYELVTTPGLFEIPRRNSEIEEYATEMSNMAKVLEEDEMSGKKVYRYRKLGPDHYRHATNYFWLAAQQVPVAKVAQRSHATSQRRRDARVV